MELSRQSPKPTRYTGIVLVVAVHLAGIYALSAGLIKAPPRPPEIVTLKPLPPEVKTPPPLEPPLQPKPPIFKEVFTPPIEPFPVPPTGPTITPDPIREGPVASVPDGPGVTGNPPPLTPPVIKATPAVTSPGAVCSVMPAPEVPAVSWSGEAVLQVLATVRGGRVVGSEMRVTQGVLDAKTKRALTRSVESALSGYQCQGDAKFQQDFAFRLE